MDRTKLACILLAGGMLLGCGDDTTDPPDPTGTTFPPRDENCAAPDPSMVCTTDTPARSEADRTVEVPMTFEDRTIAFVLSTASLPEATSDPDGDGPGRGQAVGFNVDGIDSGNGSSAADANCEEFNTDYQALTDPQHFGVDNALQGLVGTIEGLLDAMDCPGGTTDGCLDATLQQQIAEGSLILLIEVAGINDFDYDTSVSVQMHLGAVPGGGMPMVGSGGGLEGGQAFDSMMMLGPAVDGDIFNGRLRVQTDTLPLSIMAGGFDLDLMITQAQVRFDISETGLTNGAIGGVVTVDALVMAASAIMPGIEDTVRSVVESVADVDPSSDPAICGALSLGLAFTGVDATIN